jgi:hypothetical protein
LGFSLPAGSVLSHEPTAFAAIERLACANWGFGSPSAWRRTLLTEMAARMAREAEEGAEEARRDPPFEPSLSEAELRELLLDAPRCTKLCVSLEAWLAWGSRDSKGQRSGSEFFRALDERGRDLRALRDGSDLEALTEPITSAQLEALRQLDENGSRRVTPQIRRMRALAGRLEERSPVFWRELRWAEVDAAC